MKNEAFFLEGRINRVESFLGLTPENPTVSSVKFNEKVAELAQKWPKDIQTKYQRIRKLTSLYNKVLEEPVTQDKIQTLEDQQQQLSEIATQIQQIEQLSAMMNFEPLLNLNRKSKDLSLLSTTSRLECKDIHSPMTIVSYSEEELGSLNRLKRQQFEQILSLYNQMVGNLNYRLQELFNKVTRLETQ